MNPIEEGLGFLVADVSRLSRRAFEKRSAVSPLTLAQARALLHVARREGIRQVELADQLEVQPITLARLVDQLAEAGLVERRPDPTDRRAYLIYLTAAAAPHLAAIRQRIQELRAEILQGFSADEAAALLNSLQKLRNNLLAM